MSIRARFPAILIGFLAVFALAGGCLKGIGAENVVQVNTGRATDLAISGKGFFEVRDETGATYFTRTGSFVMDQDGFVVTPNGWRLQGYADAVGSRGDLRVFYDPFVSPVQPLRDDARFAGMRIQSDGGIEVILSEGTVFTVAQILLRNLKTPEASLKFQGGLILDRGELGAAAESFAPGSNGMGTLASGQLEVPRPTLTIRGKVGRVNQMRESLLVSSWVETDLAVYGKGCFIVRDPATDRRYATRAGAFYWDADGYLLNYAGYRVQGYGLGLGFMDDIRADGIDVPVPAAPDATLAGRTIRRDGIVRVHLSDGTEYESGQILLIDRARPDGLENVPFSLIQLGSFLETWQEYRAPEFDGFGMIFAGQQDLTEMDAATVEARRKMNFLVRGVFILTGRPTDCYIDGSDGFFTVRDPASNVFYATRDGAFYLDAEKFLVTELGYRVQGLNGPAQKGGTLEAKSGDLKIDAGGALKISAFSIKFDGRIRVALEDGSEFDRGQVRLQKYRNPQALVRLGNHLYGNVDLAGAFAGAVGIEPGSNGTGTIVSGAVEDITLEPGIRIPSPDAIRLILRDWGADAFIEVSSDLVNWTKLGWAGGSVLDAVEFFDETQAAEGRRYYRTRAPMPDFPGLGF